MFDDQAMPNMYHPHIPMFHANMLMLIPQEYAPNITGRKMLLYGKHDERTIPFLRENHKNSH